VEDHRGTELLSIVAFLEFELSGDFFFLHNSVFEGPSFVDESNLLCPFNPIAYFFD